MRLERRETASRFAMLAAPLIAIAVTLLACALLVAWAHEFVWSGIRSNIYLNGTIIFVFLFGKRFFY